MHPLLKKSIIALFTAFMLGGLLAQTQKSALQTQAEAKAQQLLSQLRPSNADSAISPAQKQAVLALMEDFQSTLGGVGENTTFRELAAALKKLGQIDVSQCPDSVAKTYKTFVENTGNYMEKMETILKDAKIGDDNAIQKALEAYLAKNPEGAQALSKNIQQLQQDIIAFINALLPYAM